ncbi:MAG: hypothetical protein IMY76_06135 [Chloroflexi bacterium]|nr:hypothetical protein [Chloroflexota bacterium]
MNKSKLIGGIICLAIAGLLSILNIMLSADSMMFMVGDQNMPWVPPIVLGIVGIVLIIIGASSKAEEIVDEEPVEIDEEKSALNKRLESMAWGFFLIMLGGFMFVPEEIIKGGWWSIGVGLIMLALNASRYFNGLRMSGFTTFLGIISVIGGVLDLISTSNIDGAVLLIVLGAYLIVKPYLEKRQLFGKAEIS